MARPQVADTTVFIALIRAARAGRRAHAAELRSGRFWLSAVVLAALYAGTLSRAESQQLDRFAADAELGGRLLVPDVQDWTTAGRLLSRRSQATGSLRPRDHLADLLIVLSAARIHGEVVTANVDHMEAWAELARRAGHDVMVKAA
jgi:predicted nucleic acid-binding protein